MDRGKCHANASAKRRDNFSHWILCTVPLRLQSAFPVWEGAVPGPSGTARQAMAAGSLAPRRPRSACGSRFPPQSLALARASAAWDWVGSGRDEAAAFPIDNQSQLWDPHKNNPKEKAAESDSSSLTSVLQLGGT
eukprot:CAMPEP_0174324282 /NCGR_PEP_ID=MMETSP0810-20121108/12386_1 /TAXON_ID=73025 ORGANISM="Eutreptiella gymnastica-like, Strain CCMP1594" /NCGR_SAMPLE_ID=MMETSP0810 /ASSEMBLY_ACC=CAM_ASM_000659 /LENGTH=134 /DNA_ID=CAMNT_0015437023 /DNA_START=367 /DNA_END=772 /DNA_ORIENTATION=-